MHRNPFSCALYLTPLIPTVGFQLRALIGCCPRKPLMNPVEHEMVASSAAQRGVPVPPEVTRATRMVLAVAQAGEFGNGFTWFLD
jgi:hypothetical protein